MKLDIKCLIYQILLNKRENFYKKQTKIYKCILHNLHFKKDKIKLKTIILSIWTIYIS